MQQVGREEDKESTECVALVAALLTSICRSRRTLPPYNRAPRAHTILQDSENNGKASDHRSMVTSVRENTRALMCAVINTPTNGQEQLDISLFIATPLTLTTYEQPVRKMQEPQQRRIFSSRRSRDVRTLRYSGRYRVGAHSC